MLTKRVYDLFLATTLLLLTFPLLLAIFLITWLQLRCNVIFAEQRFGRKGRLFVMYKVTTMKPTKENIAMRSLGPIKRNDPRITMFARFIRRYSLDELPQLVNVIKGDMSLIGPRPELPTSVKYWSKILPDYQQRFNVYQGMSGWAQVNGYRKGYIEPGKRLYYDLYYINHWSIWLDLKITILTPWAIVKFEVW